MSDEGTLIKIAVGEIMEAEAEPGRYFQNGQWYSVKKGDWIDPSKEIRMDAMKPKEDQAEILNETEAFIEKLEAVEKYRKESGENEIGTPKVDIVIHAAEDTIEEVTNGTTEVPYEYQVKDDETCEDAKDEDEMDAEAYYRENGIGRPQEVPAEAAEDTQSLVSVFAGVGDGSKTVFKAGEPLSNGHGKEDRDDYDIRGGKKSVVKAGVILEDDLMSRSGSIRSIRSVKGKPLDDDNISIKSVKSRKGSIKSISGSIRSIKSAIGSITSIKSKKKDRVSIVEDSIFQTRDVEIEEDNISVNTLTEENVDDVADQVARAAEEAGGATEDVVDVAENIGERAEEVAEMVESVAEAAEEVAENVTETVDEGSEVAGKVSEAATFFGRADNEEIEGAAEKVEEAAKEVAEVAEDVVVMAEEVADVEEAAGRADGYDYKARDDTESLMGDDEKEPEIYYKENGYSDEGDNVSILSYNVDGDYIADLHQRVGQEAKAPKAAARKVVEEKEVPEPAAATSYEDERASKDFEAVVRENQAKYKSERSKTNEEVDIIQVQVIECSGA